ncbi:hypothetical protein MIR68_007516 [Amoeboaphelidium protococcarum]|nr:hypothetical protein MIR68_007516 [Amoeboaphelidium protococcarum]
MATQNGDGNDSSQWKEYGRRVFNGVKVLYDYLEGPSIGRSMEPGIDNIDDAGAITNFQNDVAIEPDYNTMQDIMPLDEWKAMSNVQRHQFLDQFYPVQDKLKHDQIGEELCAQELLDLYQCVNIGGGEDLLSRWRNQYQKESFLSGAELDRCGQQRKRVKSCKELMSLTAKCEAVYGTEAKQYIQIVHQGLNDYKLRQQSL